MSLFLHAGVSLLSYIVDEVKRDYLLEYNEKKLRERRKRVYTFMKTPRELEKVYNGFKITIEGVVAPWCNPLTLQPEQSGGVGSSPGRAPPLERHDKGSRT